MRYFEDFSLGETFEFGSYHVTEEEIIAFASKYDPQSFHIDPVQAKASLFGDLVASGWHTASISMRLLVDGLFGQTAAKASPGIKDLRWLEPVRADDVLKLRFTIIEARVSQSRPRIGILQSRNELINQDGVTVMSMIASHFIGRRPETASA
ncbi:MaoC family dehydratase [Ktedonosporobacter rubrisoli]|uniref:MaoC family dehydratase n=1 Tax=Ktedonosporobacter rubrisoli TaxID=2509675 RepID=A0A4V0Z0H0_KTERU|nr:MaoC family dehydratase [Ktedonosporobacter rubrisoli]QBD83191.1 MaoC family dehydratase [Ktedonosporobacter rubrisoli]